MLAPNTESSMTQNGGNAASEEFDVYDICVVVVLRRWDGVVNSICVIVPIIMFAITNELYVKRKYYVAQSSKSFAKRMKTLCLWARKNIVWHLKSHENVFCLFCYRQQQ